MVTPQAASLKGNELGFSALALTAARASA